MGKLSSGQPFHARSFWFTDSVVLSHPTRGRRLTCEPFKAHIAFKRESCTFSAGSFALRRFDGWSLVLYIS
eukprot:12320309-Alexandrium_andersonii.AAC.1